MTRVCHLLDPSAGWEQRLGIGQLLDRLPRDKVQSTVGRIGRGTVCLSNQSNTPTHAARLQGWGDLGASVLAAPRLARFLNRRRMDIIHAWGASSAVAACVAAGSGAAKSAVVVELFDPVAATRHIKLLRTLAGSGRMAIVCSSAIVRRRLIEGGVESAMTTVIRPGVAFSVINAYRRGNLRERLGLQRDDFVFLVPGEDTAGGETCEAFRAAALVNHLSGRLRMIVPGRAPRQRRVAKLAAAMDHRSLLVTPAGDIPFEALVAVSDALVIASRGDVSTTAIAWGMGGGLLIIGAAVHAVAELCAHNVNGLLFKQTRGKSMVVAIAKLLRDRGSADKVREVARGQAYEVFSVRRYIEQHLRLYENLLAGRTPGDGIIDSAVSA